MLLLLRLLLLLLLLFSKQLCQWHEVKMPQRKR
jgi:hypothetical protein